MRYLPIVFLVLIGCLEPYQADLPPGTNDAIVIDGFVNTKDATALVTIHRTTPIESRDLPPAIEDAQVSIQSSDGKVSKLNEQSPGRYIASGIARGAGIEYTLRIVTNGKEYVSDAVTSHNTPPIDSITTGLSNTGESLSIRVNAHGQNGSNYYSWDFTETFEYTAMMYSGLVNTPNGPRPRRPEEDFYRCWKTNPGKKISISSTKGLSSNVVSNFELLTIPKGSLKLTKRYSVIVSQRTIDEEEYNYLLLLQKTTESIGGLFDPLPAPIRGNLHNSEDPSEPVVGYFRAGEVEERRFFLAFDDLPEDFKLLPKVNCQIYKSCLKPYVIVPGPGTTCVQIQDVPEFFPILAEYEEAREVYYWTYVSRECADCRQEGGITTRPDFW